MKFIPTLLSCFLFLFFSCGKRVDLQTEIKATDSLKKELLEKTARFNLLDSSQIKSYATRINSIFALVNANLHDTITRNEAILLSDLKNASKAFKKFERTRKDISRYYNYNLKQLENLSYDLMNGNIAVKDSAIKYFFQEKKANTELITMMRLHSEIIPNKLKKCDSIFPIVNEWLTKLNNGVAPQLLENNTSNNATEVEED